MEKRFEDLHIDESKLVHITGDEVITGNKTINEVYVGTKGVQLSKPGTRLMLTPFDDVAVFLSAIENGRLSANGAVLATLDDLTAATAGGATQTVQLSYVKNIAVPATGAQSFAVSTGTTNVLDVNVLEAAGGVRPIWSSFYSVSGTSLTFTADANLKSGDTLSWTQVSPATASGGGSSAAPQVVEARTANGFPNAGAAATIYIDQSTQRLYRYSASLRDYVELVPDPDLAATTGNSTSQAMSQAATTTAIGLRPVQVVTGNNLAIPEQSGTLYLTNSATPVEFTLYADINSGTVVGNYFYIRQMGAGAVYITARVPNGLTANPPTITTIDCGKNTTGVGNTLMVHKIGPGDTWVVTPAW